MQRLRMRPFAFGLTVLSLCAYRPALAETAIDRIKDEGLNRSKVMETLSYLTDVIGPRLTGSPGMLRANHWTKDRLTEWGMKNARLEAWGPFGRGWTLQRFSLQVVEPHAFPLIAYPKAWSPGWKGTITGDVVHLEATDEAGLEKYRGKLKGAIVLVGAARPVAAHFTPNATRWTDERLAALTTARERPRPGRPPGGAGGPGGRPGGGEFAQRAQFASKRAEFLKQEGAALVVEPSSKGDGGTLFVQSASVPSPGASGGGRQADQATQPADRSTAGRSGPGRRIAAYSKDAPPITPQAVMAIEHFNRLVRMLQAGEKLRASGELSVKFHDRDPMSYNTIAEIPGTDLKDEIVMLGAHMDSWHSGTGATDNAAGVAVCMEAVRILQAQGLQPRRTIRVALWSGEEQGLLGSRAYVAEHFGAMSQASPGGGARTLDKKPDYDKLSAYFNLDNGTGKIRGVYCQGNAGVKPIFEEWLAPFKETGASTLTLANTGSTDHTAFDGIGLPGFQFIQDEIEYSPRTHHSNMDLYDRIQPDDVKQAAVIMATFVYNTAMRDEKLPRKQTTPTTPAAP
jgi:carboxypeptidase Q